MARVLDCGLEVNKFEFHSSHYVPFRTNTPGKCNDPPPLYRRNNNRESLHGVIVKAACNLEVREFELLSHNSVSNLGKYKPPSLSGICQIVSQVFFYKGSFSFSIILPTKVDMTLNEETKPTMTVLRENSIHLHRASIHWDRGTVEMDRYQKFRQPSPSALEQRLFTGKVLFPEAKPPTSRLGCRIH